MQYNMFIGYMEEDNAISDLLQNGLEVIEGMRVSVSSADWMIQEEEPL